MDILNTSIKYTDKILYYLLHSYRGDIESWAKSKGLRIFNSDEDYALSAGNRMFMDVAAHAFSMKFTYIFDKDKKLIAFFLINYKIKSANVYITITDEVTRVAECTKIQATCAEFFNIKYEKFNNLIKEKCNISDFPIPNRHRAESAIYRFCEFIEQNNDPMFMTETSTGENIKEFFCVNKPDSFYNKDTLCIIHRPTKKVIIELEKTHINKLPTYKYGVLDKNQIDYLDLRSKENTISNYNEFFVNVSEVVYRSIVDTVDKRKQMDEYIARNLSELLDMFFRNEIENTYV